MLARFAAAALVVSGTAWGQLVVTEEAKLVASDAESGDQFGSSVAIDGNTAVIGARFEATAGASAGAAYVFVHNGSTWVEQQKLVASDAESGDLFGAAVSVSGDTIVIGAYGDDHARGADAGSAYVFARTGSTWVEQQKFTASNASYAAGFGVSVAVSSDVIVVGAPGGNVVNDDFFVENPTGAAYVFMRNDNVWSERQILTGSDTGVGDSFGGAVALDGATAIIGARHHTTGDTMSTSFAGAAYVFVRGGATWIEQQELIAIAEDNRQEFFGASVAISGDSVVVGCESVGTTNPGSAFVFVRSGGMWSQEQQLAASDGGLGDGFGSSVAVSGNLAVIGAFLDPSVGIDSGSAYVFVRRGTIWLEQHKLSSSTAGDWFGLSVATSGDRAVVGSPRDEPAILNQGSGSVFQFNSPSLLSDSAADTSESDWVPPARQLGRGTGLRATILPFPATSVAFECVPVWGYIPPDPVGAGIIVRYQNTGSAPETATVSSARLVLAAPGQPGLTWSFTVTPPDSGPVAPDQVVHVFHTKDPGSGIGTLVSDPLPDPVNAAHPCGYCEGRWLLIMEWTTSGGGQIHDFQEVPFYCPSY